YSPAAHCALMVMQSAKYARPFNSYANEEYKQEVAMLRPGATVPHPSTISRDLKHVYLQMSQHVKNHFLVN
ncbi:hypothetical protein CPB83DRAFT_749886, partial [Crepidotus variabilis]